MNKDLFFSSEKDDWSTPKEFFAAMDEKHHFNLDVAASPENAKCERFFTENENGLVQNWGVQRVVQSSIRATHRRVG